MQSDLNVALMVYAPKLATAGTVYNSTVRLSLIPHNTGLPITEARAAIAALCVALRCHTIRGTAQHSNAPHCHRNCFAAIPYVLIMSDAIKHH